MEAKALNIIEGVAGAVRPTEKIKDSGSVEEKIFGGFETYQYQKQPAKWQIKINLKVTTSRKYQHWKFLFRIRNPSAEFAIWQA